MTAWQVDEMWEASAAAEWERINEADPAESRLKEAGAVLKSALELIGSGTLRLYDAVAILDETPMGDKVNSILESMEELETELKSMAQHYEKGERE